MNDNSRREQLAYKCDKYKSIVTLEDGYQYLWVGGACSANDLRILADILDERNKEWDTIVQTTNLRPINEENNEFNN